MDGSTVSVPARSVCVHGDTPGAVDLARAVRAGLRGAGVTVAPFAAPESVHAPGASRAPGT